MSLEVWRGILVKIDRCLGADLESDLGPELTVDECDGINGLVIGLKRKLISEYDKERDLPNETELRNAGLGHYYGVRLILAVFGAVFDRAQISGLQSMRNDTGMTIPALMGVCRSHIDNLKTDLRNLVVYRYMPRRADAHKVQFKHNASWMIGYYMYVSFGVYWTKEFNIFVNGGVFEGV